MIRFPVNDGFFPQLHNGVEDEHAHAHADTGERVLHGGQVREVLDKGRDNHNDDERREHDAQRGKNAAPDARCRSCRRPAVQ